MNKQKENTMNNWLFTNTSSLDCFAHCQTEATHDSGGVDLVLHEFVASPKELSCNDDHRRGSITHLPVNDICQQKTVKEPERLLSHSHHKNKQKTRNSPPSEGPGDAIRG
jgi:hypothetical protein